jgi:hypothetical protein
MPAQTSAFAQIKLNNVIVTTDGNNRLRVGNSGVYYSGENYGGFITSSNLQGFPTSGNLESTGTALQTQITNSLGTKVTGVSITGGIAITGAVNISAGTNITLTQAGLNTFTIASTAAGGALGGVTGITISGSVAISGAIQFIGAYGTNVIHSGNTIGISGGGAGGGTTNNTYNINSGSGIFIYRSGIASGVSQQFINFPTTLDASPLVIATLHNDNFNNILSCQISGANQNGFYALLSANTPNTGYYLDIFASNSTQTGMATNVIVNNFVVSTWSNLIWGTTTTWTATPNTYEDRKILVMTGNTILSITSLYNGWAGVLQTIQSGILQSSGGYSLALPVNTQVANAGSGIIYLTSGSGSIDMVGFQYNGSKLFANMGNQFN